MKIKEQEQEQEEKEKAENELHILSFFLYQEIQKGNLVHLDLVRIARDVSNFVMGKKEQVKEGA